MNHAPIPKTEMLSSERTSEKGRTQALAFAKRWGVRVWLTEKSDHFTLVEDFRIAQSV